MARRVRVPLGFAFGLAYLWLAQPTVLSICIGAAIVVIGLAVRAIASGQLNKNEQLATSGPYSYTRNPLYLGSLLIGIGWNALSCPSGVHAASSERVSDSASRVRSSWIRRDLPIPASPLTRATPPVPAAAEPQQ